ncbi:hypothetical protein Htur_0587 [Haloterrigena turkmenica DSM 5511]|uniref:DUF456 domain-containing protein n=1 Tax=Haloterrigena turkmenica (strain ATCC 51198 / DSM 5511 / JCM 9101 / NCIMB 13204 / VKM B-1734 / 4k) TaxID=543526 RepID=D2RW96_HALTV|nr:hypothetical protein [Haloterrigena turkmenica]ADB59485.1 hypothetical protein Htur_0587 [Haloterrigena turkmenica DSM 5511]
MSDRSDEVTESRDTDDLLEETESLLSGSDVEADSGAGTASTPEDRPGTGGGVGTIDDPLESGTLRSSDEPAPSTAQPAESSRSRLGRLRARLTPGRSPGDYFSPRAFLTLVLLVGAGLVGGGMAIPIAGRMLGMFGVAFAIGLLTSKRRYLEMGAAGTAVGGVSAVLSNAVLAIAGSTQAVLAVGVTVGLVGCLLGYYFGRDLRNGLTQDIK